MRKPRGSDGEDESTNLEGKRVKTKAYEFVWGGREREGYLPVRTRYIRTYRFYRIEIF